MARVLLTGSAARLAPVAERLLADGYAVRCAVPGGVEVCGGVESVDATPRLPGGVVMALDAVAVVCWLLGDADWSDPLLHDGQLETMLARVVDTGVRGFVYERPAGFDGAGALAASGERQLAHAAQTWHVPVAIVERGGEGEADLAQRVAAAVSCVLAAS